MTNERIEENGGEEIINVIEEDEEDVDDEVPEDAYDEDNPLHEVIDSMRHAIANFLFPESKEILDHLQGKDVDFLRGSFRSPCVCGCYTKLTIIEVFTRADPESLRYIIENELLEPEVLCTILSEMLPSSGTLSYPERLIYELKLQGRDFHEENTSLASGWLDLTDPNISFLLTYLCENHPETVRTWQSRELIEEHQWEETLLHVVMHGHSELKKQWVEQLLAVGCDPFASNNGYPPLRFFFTQLWSDKAISIASTRPKREIAELLGKVIIEFEFDRQNILMEILERYRHAKTQETLQQLIKAVRYLVEIDSDHHMLSELDAHGRNFADYVHQYGYTELFESEQKMAIPNPTGTIYVSPLIGEKNPLRSADILHKHRYAKTRNEVEAFWREYHANGRLTKEQHEDTGNHRYDSIERMMCRYNFK